MRLLALFVVVPLIEIALFIQVGGWVGLWPTLAIVVLTAIAGTALVRQQGALALRQLRRSFHELRDPAEPLAHGAMILVSGALLLTPGFFTDAVGFALLIPPVRHAAYRQLRRRITVQSFDYGASPRPGPDRTPRGWEVDDEVIEGEFTETEPPKRPTHRPASGWTRH